MSSRLRFLLRVAIAPHTPSMARQAGRGRCGPAHRNGESALGVKLREIDGAVAGDAHGEVDLPGEIFSHRRGAIARALVGLEPDIDRLICHSRMIGGEYTARGKPGGIAAIERANGTIDKRTRARYCAAREHAILGGEHERPAQRYLDQRALEP